MTSGSILSGQTIDTNGKTRHRVASDPVVFARVQHITGVRLPRESQNSATAELLRRLIDFDRRTGIYTYERFRRECSDDIISKNDALRTTSTPPEPSTLVFCDFNYLKSYNDAFGQEKTDRIIESIATQLDKAVKKLNPKGVTARRNSNGDEFLILLRDCDQAKGEEIMRQIAKIIQETVFIVPDIKRSGITKTKPFGKDNTVLGTQLTNATFAYACQEISTNFKVVPNSRSDNPYFTMLQKGMSIVRNYITSVEKVMDTNKKTEKKRIEEEEKTSGINPLKPQITEDVRFTKEKFEDTANDLVLVPHEPPSFRSMTFN